MTRGGGGGGGGGDCGRLQIPPSAVLTFASQSSSRLQWPSGLWLFDPRGLCVDIEQFAQVRQEENSNWASHPRISFSFPLPPISPCSPSLITSSISPALLPGNRQEGHLLPARKPQEGLAKKKKKSSPRCSAVKDSSEGPSEATALFFLSDYHPLLQLHDVSGALTCKIPQILEWISRNNISEMKQIPPKKPDKACGSLKITIFRFSCWSASAPSANLKREFL